MICPICNEEYRDGFTRCSDCNVDLVEKKEIIEEKWLIRPVGIRLIKFGAILLFIAFAELIAAILVNTVLNTNINKHGFASYIFDKRIWYIFVAEIAVSLTFMIWGISFRKKIIRKRKV